ncbi:MAG TPA: ABC transporter ATP-binding protein [Bacilli bacterium]
MDDRTETVLSVQGLWKKIGRKMIIRDISFEIGAGEIFGFLGPNGSGKTTTIRMLVGLVRPTKGSVLICGKDVQREHDEALAQVGSIVENPEMYSFMSGMENLLHFARMQPNVTSERIDEVVELVGLTERIHDKVKTYSLGMKQRLGLAQALLGRPKLLILDEPTNGLDPQGIKELRDFIHRLADTGIGILISSHLLSEVQLICERVAIIKNGEVIAIGRVDELLRHTGTRIVWHVDDAAKASGILRQYCAKNNLELLPFLADTDAPVAEHAEKVAAEMDAALLPEINARFVQAGIRVFAAQAKQPSLEELFLNMTGGDRID